MKEKQTAETEREKEGQTEKEAEQPMIKKRKPTNKTGKGRPKQKQQVGYSFYRDFSGNILSLNLTIHFLSKMILNCSFDLVSARLRSHRQTNRPEADNAIQQRHGQHRQAQQSAKHPGIAFFSIQLEMRSKFRFFPNKKLRVRS